MNRIITFLAIISIGISLHAANLSDLTWSNVCGGGMGTEWYATDEAVSIADTLVAVQKLNGGWMKNYEYHQLTANQLKTFKATRNDESCLDNWATSQEMKFLARVWQGTKIERFHTAFLKALDMLFAAQKPGGGWSQYWPLRRDGNYFDVITFNDDLMTNCMRMMRDISDNRGIYRDITDADTRRRCRESLDRAVELTLKCQYDDNGVKAAWCAQHDSIDFLPVAARGFEMPSISGCESVSLLNFLMSLPNPSPRLQESVIAAVEWLDSHRINDVALEAFTDEEGQKDYRIVDAPGSSLWARFIQLGGNSGAAVYDKFFNWLRQRNKKITTTCDGVRYTYTEEEIARSTYREEMAYQPIYGSHGCYHPLNAFRFLYNYEDT